MGTNSGRPSIPFDVIGGNARARVDYRKGKAPAHFPMPAVRHTTELVVLNDRARLLVMYRDYPRGMGYMAVVGDYPGMPLRV